MTTTIRSMLAAVFAMALLPAAPAAAQTAGDTLVFTAVADAYVDASRPTSSFGATSTSLYADADPIKKSFLRFEVSGIGPRSVLSVRLRMYQKGSSNLGGRIFTMTSTGWDESVTWDTQPAIDGPQVGAFGPVGADTMYETVLAPSVGQDGSVSLAIDSTSVNGARWASRESLTPPELIVQLRPTGDPTSELTEVAGPREGSSDPTYYATNHRLATTSGGRLLTVHGLHAEGVQLAWRDPGAAWKRTTTGAVSDGRLLTGTTTGDWTASIAVAKDANGAEHAWAVWARVSSSSTRPVQMRRLTNLDSPSGPSVGPIVTVEAPANGAHKADIAFERAPDGKMRGAIVYSRRPNSTDLQVVVRWFTDLTKDNPKFKETAVLWSSTSFGRYAGLLETSQGLRAVARVDSGSLRVFSHAPSAGLKTWSQGASGMAMTSSSFPGSVGLSNGHVLVAADADPATGVVRVQRVAPGAIEATDELTLPGYREPALTTNGTKAWLIMVRASDGDVVSRTFDPATGWSAEDRVEIGAEAGGGLQWPNPIRTVSGRLDLVVRGPLGGTSRAAVLAYSRSL